MLELPELFERHMNLGEKALENKEYDEAKEHFEAAYELEDSAVANFYLVKTLILLKQFPLAYEILSEKKALYQSDAAYQKLYFDVLIQLNYFFEIEKLLVVLKTSHLEDYKKVYQIAKDYQLLMRKDDFNKIEDSIAQMGEAVPMNQSLLLKQLKFLPSERVLRIAPQLLLDPKVSLFSKSELIQQLAALKYDKPLKVLTFNHNEKEFIPEKVKTLNEVYLTNEILIKVSDYFEEKAPSLKKEVEQTVKLHIGCVYPFQEEEMSPVMDWVSSYIKKYLGEDPEKVDSVALKEIDEKQGIFDSELFKLLSFE